MLCGCFGAAASPISPPASSPSSFYYIHTIYTMCLIKCLRVLKLFWVIIVVAGCIGHSLTRLPTFCLTAHGQLRVSVIFHEANTHVMGLSTILIVWYIIKELISRRTQQVQTIFLPTEKPMTLDECAPNLRMFHGKFISSCQCPR